ncbi:MAG TPA: patatin-like phospholipase family protein [Rhodocyclaceae bacterium]
MPHAPAKNVPSKRKALLIGGGAPNATLMAGALVAMLECGVEFDVISTSGAGALIGLLYAAPRGGDPIQALQNTVKLGISDEIYNLLPVNYKVFNKPGPGADLFRQLLEMNPFSRGVLAQDAQNGPQRLFNDWLQLCWATLTPSDVTPESLGLCAHVPFAEEVVDFDALRRLPAEFYINAFNVTQGRMAIWGKQEINAEHFRAALSFPLIYPPYRLGGDDYIEGAAIDTINFRALVADKPPRGAAQKSFQWQGAERGHGLHEDLDTLVVFDILGSDKLIRTPRNLYDAWVKSIITPLVEIARDDVRLFELEHNRNKDGSDKRRLLKVPLLKSVPDDAWAEILDWSESNLARLYQIGHQAGRRFCDEHAVALNIA